MNLFFGRIDKNGDVQRAKERANRHCETRFGASPSIVAERKNLLTSLLDSKGSVIGFARHEKYVLVFNGFFFEPFPLKIQGRAIDNPHGVAAALLDRYLDKGLDFLDKILGYYSLAVIDEDSNTVHVASDPYGQRTTYIRQDADSFCFSSNLAVAAQLVDNLKIDRSWEDFFLVYGFYPHGRTPYAEVTSAPSGKIVSWRNGVIEARPIKAFHPPIERRIQDDTKLEKVSDELYEAFMEALIQQTGDNDRAGVLLGGFDSALVAAALHRLGKKVTTWSFHYDQDQYNQPHTDDLAKHLGIRHEWVHIDQEHIEKGIEQFPWIFNQPTNWPNYVIQTALVMQKMADAGISQAFSGDGCDTVFLGYPGTWRRARVLEHVPSAPPALANTLARLLSRPYLERTLGHPYRVVLNLVRTSAWPRHSRGFLSFRILDELSLQQLRRDLLPPDQGMSLRAAVEELSAAHRDLPALRLAYLGKSLVSPNKNKMNGSSDLTGIPILSPYMHPTFKRFAQSLPEELCRPNETTASKVTGKYVLMKMAEMKGLLPDSVIYQKKMAAVDAPIDAWYAGPMRKFMMRQMESLPFDANTEYLESLLQPHLAERLFQKYFLTDKVIKHAPSLLATYARFCSLADEPSGTSSTNT